VCRSKHNQIVDTAVLRLVTSHEAVQMHCTEGAAVVKRLVSMAIAVAVGFDVCVLQDSSVKA
jgi:hypothetical protein